MILSPFAILNEKTAFSRVWKQQLKSLHSKKEIGGKNFKFPLTLTSNFI